MISAYPLQWPSGWKRTTSRKDGKFSKNRLEVSITEGANRVIRELERMGVNAGDVVISTNVQPRLDGMPRAGERKPQDPGAAVYWQERKTFRAGEWFTPPPRVMAIDIYSEVADNLAAVAATLEAMRAIERHGGAAILERAFTGFTALPSPESGKHWREVLNLPGKTVERSHVDEAYRSIARRAHPDKGGTHEQMAELNRAREQALQEIGP